MLKTTACPDYPPRWTHRHALERQLGLPRGMLLCGSQQHDSLIARAAAATGLDGAALARLPRMLALTVTDWLKK